MPSPSLALLLLRLLMQQHTETACLWRVRHDKCMAVTQARKLRQGLN